MYKVERYPPTTQKSLQAWSAADEHVLRYIEELKIHSGAIVIINDRFGFLTTHLHDSNPQIRIHYASQKKSILLNLDQNGLDKNSVSFQSGEDKIDGAPSLVIIRVPKSLAFFRIILAYVQSYCSSDTIVLCSFMTRHFSKQILQIGENYFKEVKQSLAWKKSRLLILNGSKKQEFDLEAHTHSIEFKDKTYLQYAGVFSSDHIDYATQFLLENLRLKDEEKDILDLACGNGVIASEIDRRYPERNLTLIDDSYLAMASAKLNLDEKHTFVWDDTLESIENDSMDLAVSNPPFHFEYETNIDIAFSLFKEVKRVLRPGGRFVMVASKHLNFNKHLEKLLKFQGRNENKKFEVLRYQK